MLPCYWRSPSPLNSVVLSVRGQSKLPTSKFLHPPLPKIFLKPREEATGSGIVIQHFEITQGSRSQRQAKWDRYRPRGWGGTCIWDSVLDYPPQSRTKVTGQEDTILDHLISLYLLPREKRCLSTETSGVEWYDPQMQRCLPLGRRTGNTWCHVPWHCTMLSERDSDLLTKHSSFYQRPVSELLFSLSDLCSCSFISPLPPSLILVVSRKLFLSQLLTLLMCYCTCIFTFSTDGQQKWRRWLCSSSRLEPSRWLWVYRQSNQFHGISYLGSALLSNSISTLQIMSRTKTHLGVHLTL